MAARRGPLEGGGANGHLNHVGPAESGICVRAHGDRCEG